MYLWSTKLFQYPKTSMTIDFSNPYQLSIMDKNKFRSYLLFLLEGQKVWEIDFISSNCQHLYEALQVVLFVKPRVLLLNKDVPSYEILIPLTFHLILFHMFVWLKSLLIIYVLISDNVFVVAIFYVCVCVSVR